MLYKDIIHLARQINPPSFIFFNGTGGRNRMAALPYRPLNGRFDYESIRD